MDFEAKSEDCFIVSSEKECAEQSKVHAARAKSGSTVYAWSGSTVHAKSGSIVHAESGSMRKDLDPDKEFCVFSLR